MEHLKSFAANETSKLKKQVDIIAEHPAFKNEIIRIMPDAHVGRGVCIGFTSTFSDKVIPSIVGADIGCRVSMYETPFHWADVNEKEKKFLRQFDAVVHSKVPAGLGIIRTTPNKYANNFWSRFSSLRCFPALKNVDKISCSMGSLGSGNHFIALNRAQTHDAVYLTVHTGSRNLGQQVMEYYQHRAIENCNSDKKEIKQLIERLKEEGRREEIEHQLKNFKSSRIKFSNDLCYIEGSDLEDYLHDMTICCEWSYWNHVSIINSIMNSYGSSFNESKMETCIHNYVDIENHIIRKGAISAKEGEVGFIPMNMRDGVCRMVGKGNEDWNCSLPHGCGRKMSRKEARDSLDIFDYEYEMEDVYSSCVNEDTIDEAPMVYKDPEDVIEISTVSGRITGIFPEVYNFKGV